MKIHILNKQKHHYLPAYLVTFQHENEHKHIALVSHTPHQGIKLRKINNQTKKQLMHLSFPEWQDIEWQLQNYIEYN